MLDVLTDLFYQAGLRTNTQKTVSKSCQTYHTPGRISVVAYDRRVTGNGDGSDILGAAEDAGPMPRVWSIGCSRVASDESSYSSRLGPGKAGGGTPPSPSW